MQPAWVVKRLTNVTRTKYAVIRFSTVPREAIDALAEKVDRGVAQISSYLRAAPPGLIDIRLIDRNTVSAAYQDSTKIVITRGRLPNRTAVVHELTHLIAGVAGEASGPLYEGLAVYLQEKFGGEGDYSFPTFGRDLHVETLRVIAKCNGALPLTRTALARRGAHPQDDQRTLAYLQEGSFVRFLTETYGIEKVMRVYRGQASWIEALGQSMLALQALWLEALFEARSEACLSSV